MLSAFMMITWPGIKAFNKNLATNDLANQSIRHYFIAYKSNLIVIQHESHLSNA